MIMILGGGRHLNLGRRQAHLSWNVLSEGACTWSLEGVRGIKLRTSSSERQANER